MRQRALMVLMRPAPERSRIEPRRSVLSPELPWHVLLVHVPLGGAMLLPVVAAVLVLAPREDRRTWGVAVLLQAAVVVGGLLAAASGEKQGLAVQFLVDRGAIAAHETAAHWFLAASVATLVAFGVGLSRRDPVYRRRAAGAALVLGLLAAGLGANAGHLGGDLVFQEGAVRAHEEAAQPKTP